MTAPEMTLDTISLERDGHVLAIGLNRPEKRNAFNLASGDLPMPEDGRDPWRLEGT
jgi:hypothetical protein